MAARGYCVLDVACMHNLLMHALLMFPSLLLYEVLQWVFVSSCFCSFSLWEMSILIYSVLLFSSSMCMVLDAGLWLQLTHISKYISLIKYWKVRINTHTTGRYCTMCTAPTPVTIANSALHRGEITRSELHSSASPLRIWKAHFRFLSSNLKIWLCAAVPCNAFTLWTVNHSARLRSVRKAHKVH